MDAVNGVLLTLNWDHDMSEWINLKKEKPKDGQMIFYSTGNEMMCGFGRYCGDEDHMPSSPYWLQWEKVKYWMPVVSFPKEKE